MNKKLFLWVGIMFISMTYSWAQAYSGGGGYAGNPFLIANKTDLKYLSEHSSDWSKNFTQTADIIFDASDFAIGGDFYNNGNGFRTIGNNTLSFSGVYNGGGHTISNLYIDRTNFNSIGLFGLTSLATIAYLGVINETVWGNKYVGGLIGYAFQTSITNCYVTGGTVSAMNEMAGGLVGYSTNSAASASYTSVYVTCIGPNSGGFIGFNHQTNIANCYALGSVYGTDNVGGLLGNAYVSHITGCHANGAINGVSNLGGLIGNDAGSQIWTSIAYGNVTGSTGQIGGLVGNSGYNQIYGCSAHGAVSGFSSVGGLVGYQEINSHIGNSYATGNVNGDSYVGGLVGYCTQNVIVNSNYNSNTVTGVNKVGGLIGWLNNGCSVNFCHSTISVTGNSLVGGLVGESSNTSSINNCYNTAWVSGTGNYVGGVVGRNNSNSDVKKSYSSGTVTGSGFAGGLVGFNNNLVSECYAIGDVNGSYSTGGFAGGNVGIIRNCYAKGAVQGVDRVGGFIGNNSYFVDAVNTYFFPVKNCYSIGAVSGTTNVGGFMGFDDNGSVIQCYWNTETSGQWSSISGTGKTTYQMQLYANYINGGWDFRYESANGVSDFWKFSSCQNNSYPILDWQVMNQTPATAILNQAICYGSTYNFYGENLTNAGTYQHFIQDSSSCDSIIILNLSIQQQPPMPTGLACYQTAVWNSNACQWDIIGTAPAPIITTATACGSYTWSINNVTYNTSGIYTFLDPNNNCINYELHLTLTSGNPNVTYDTACGSYYWNMNGITYTTSGTYTTGTGCSMETLNLIIHPLPVVSAANVSACLGSSVNLLGSPAGGTWNLPNPYTGMATSYDYFYTDANGCSNSASASITSGVAMISNLYATNITGISAIINYNVVNGIGWYEVRYKPVSSTQWITSTTSVNFKNIIGLSPNTIYNLEVRGFCSASTPGPWSSSTFTTNNACGMPTNLTVTNITGTTAKLNWDAVSGAGFYSIRYKLQSSGTWINSTNTVNNKILASLLPNSNYEFQVKTNCGNASSAYSSSYLFTTMSSRGNDEIVKQSNELVTLYPNPVIDDLHFDLYLEEASPILISILDMTGRTIKEIHFQGEVGSNQLIADLQQIASGVYTLQISNSKKVIFVDQINRQ